MLERGCWGVIMPPLSLSDNSWSRLASNHYDQEMEQACAEVLEGFVEGFLAFAYS